MKQMSQKKYLEYLPIQTISRRSMHFHIESTLLWSMPLDHSEITHDAIGKS